jgi:hypothetical protein
LGSPLVKVARESTSNGLAESSGAIRVAHSAKSEAVQGRIPSKGRRLSNCLSYCTKLSVGDTVFLRKGEMPQKRKFLRLCPEPLSPDKHHF